MKICWKGKMMIVFHIYFIMMIWMEMGNRNWELIRDACICLIMKLGRKGFVCFIVRNPVILGVY